MMTLLKKAADCADYLDFTRLKFTLFCLQEGFFRKLNDTQYGVYPQNLRHARKF